MNNQVGYEGHMKNPQGHVFVWYEVGGYCEITMLIG